MSRSLTNEHSLSPAEVGRRRDPDCFFSMGCGGKPVRGGNAEPTLTLPNSFETILHCVSPCPAEAASLSSASRAETYTVLHSNPRERLGQVGGRAASKAELTQENPATQRPGCGGAGGARLAPPPLSSSLPPAALYTGAAPGRQPAGASGPRRRRRRPPSSPRGSSCARPGSCRGVRLWGWEPAASSARRALGCSWAVSKRFRVGNPQLQTASSWGCKWHRAWFRYSCSFSTIEALRSVRSVLLLGPRGSSRVPEAGTSSSCPTEKSADTWGTLAWPLRSHSARISSSAFVACPESDWKRQRSSPHRTGTDLKLPCVGHTWTMRDSFTTGSAFNFSPCPWVKTPRHDAKTEAEINALLPKRLI